ncbi:MAG TPA: exodeoxyribonuclease VII large subunit, partial [Clostridiales bacterium]|nr:exodeoxyribonuclease VII large subunit [Clostridiales bacterium]
GHVYFSLKDQQSKINCVLFKSYCQSVKFELHDGLHIIVKGYVSIFERDGQYQLYVENIEPEGIGSLYLAFEQLKEKLEKEGLFDPSLKKPLPPFPKKIALITSPTGAAVQDILSVIQRRNHCVDITIFPVLVQGENAAAQISEAIRRANRCFDDIDIIILARGGGSIEELWAFNEEIVARSIFDSRIPIISAIGHETDYTIADFVSDLRAPTPSVAAELAVPRLIDIKSKIEMSYRRINELIVQKVKDKRNELKQLDELKLLSYMKDKIAQNTQWLDSLQKDLISSLKMKLQTYKGNLNENAAKLEALSPISTISRGYSVLFDLEKNDSIDSILNVEIGQRVKILLKDGFLFCTVDKKEKEDNLLERIQTFKTTG